MDNKPFAFNRQDALLVDSASFASTALGTAVTTAFDLGADAAKSFRGELLVETSAIASTALGSAETVTVSIEDSADDSSFATVADKVLVVTGDGDDTAAASARYALPSTIRRYVRAKATNGSSITGDLSDDTLTASLLF